MSCSASTAPPPPPLAPAGEDGSGGAIGIALCLLSVLLLAIGITIQKYALTFIEPHVLLGDCCGTQSIRGPLARVPRTHAVWLAGLTVYFGGNGVFVLALAFTPASLAAALMATIVVANAALSRCVLHEELRRCDYHGGALILGGIAVTGWYAPAEVVSYDAPALARLLSPTSNPFGFGYLLVLVLSVTALAVLVVRHEAAHRADIQPLRAATPAAVDAFGEGGACSCRGEPAACSPSTLESGRCPAATAIALSATPASAPAATALSAAAPSASAPSAAAIAAAAAAVPRPSSAAAAAAASPASAAAAPATAAAAWLAVLPRAGCAAEVSAPSMAAVPAAASAGGLRTASPQVTGSPSPVRGAAEGAASTSRLESAMPFAYPIVVGGLETLVQMCMKGGSSMLALTAVGDSQLCFAFFWVVLLAWALLSLAAIYWLRKGLVHLPASRLLPIEYGTVTTTSVLGGLVVYQEHKYVPVSPNLSVMGFGIGLICVGCALVGRRKTLKRKYMPHQLGRQAVRQGAQACDKAAHEVRRAVSSLEQHTPRLIKRDARPYHHRAHRHHEVFPSVDEAGEEASRSAELAAAAAAALAAAPSGAPARRAVLREVAPPLAPLDSVVVGSGERGGGKTVKLLPDAPL